ncbi:MAG TPA: hypothetical protein VGR90_08410 [Acidimicrobiales bacterium]|nr:hypothetical protein [Acidimicrobiales bacterium]
MNETRWERYGAGAGIAFVAFAIIGTFVVPLTPHIDASVGSIAAYVSSHHNGLMTSALLLCASALAFLWFTGHLRHVLQRSEGGAEALSPMVYGAGIATAVIAIVAAVPMAVLGFMAGRPSDPISGAVIRMLFDSNWVLGAMTGLAAGLFLVAASVAMIRKEMVSVNLGWLGMLAAMLIWISSAADLYAHRYSAGLSVLGLIGYLGFALWTLLCSVLMYRHPEVERAEAHHPVFA